MGAGVQCTRNDLLSRHTGVVQALLPARAGVDNSLLCIHFRHLPHWRGSRGPTWLFWLFQGKHDAVSYSIGRMCMSSPTQFWLKVAARICQSCVTWTATSALKSNRMWIEHDTCLRASESWCLQFPWEFRWKGDLLAWVCSCIFVVLFTAMRWAVDRQTLRQQHCRISPS